jgi:hypothetical protein
VGHVEFVLTLALTLILSFEEREQPLAGFWIADVGSAISDSRLLGTLVI